MRKIKCPRCGSTNISEYLKEIPVITPTLEEEIKERKVILGKGNLF